MVFIHRYCDREGMRRTPNVVPVKSCRRRTEYRTYILILLILNLGSTLSDHQHHNNMRYIIFSPKTSLWPCWLSLSITILHVLRVKRIYKSSDSKHLKRFLYFYITLLLEKRSSHLSPMKITVTRLLHYLNKVNSIYLII